MLAETMALGLRAASRWPSLRSRSGVGELGLQHRVGAGRAAAQVALVRARRGRRSRARAACVSTPPRSCWPCCSVHGGWKASDAGALASRRDARAPAARGTSSGSSSLRSRVSALTRARLVGVGGVVRAARGRIPCTVTPQPDAFMTIASTAPRRDQRPPGVDVARACRRGRRRGRRRCSCAPRRSSRRSSATTVWMPAASSTRAVALLMLGSIAGCTQPISISTLRGCSRVGQRCARAGARGRHLGLAAPPAAAARTAWPSFIAGANSGDGQAFLQQPAQRALAGRALRPSRRRCGGRCRPGGRTARPTGRCVSQLRQVRQRSRCSCVAARRRLAFEHLLDQVDAAARAVELVAEQLVGRAGGGAEAAVHALAQDRLGLAAVGRAGEFGSECRSACGAVLRGRG